MNLFVAPQLRDLFAMHAMEGYLAAHAGDETSLPKRSEVAEYAYLMADAMLARRKVDHPAVPAEIAPPAPAGDDAFARR